MQPDPLYQTKLGKAFCADSLEFMRTMRGGYVDLVLTSPPYALHFKKEYGNADQKEYVEWFLPFAEQIKRVLTAAWQFRLERRRQLDTRSADSVPLPLPAVARVVR